jgi:hypothetical protein
MVLIALAFHLLMTYAPAASFKGFHGFRQRIYSRKARRILRHHPAIYGLPNNVPRRRFGRPEDRLGKANS